MRSKVQHGIRGPWSCNDVRLPMHSPVQVDILARELKVALEQRDSATTHLWKSCWLDACEPCWPDARRTGVYSSCHISHATDVAGSGMGGALAHGPPYVWQPQMGWCHVICQGRVCMRFRLTPFLSCQSISCEVRVCSAASRQVGGRVDCYCETTCGTATVSTQAEMLYLRSFDGWLPP